MRGRSRQSYGALRPVRQLVCAYRTLHEPLPPGRRLSSFLFHNRSCSLHNGSIDLAQTAVRGPHITVQYVKPIRGRSRKERFVGF